MPVGVVPQRLPDLPLPLRRQADEEPERALRRVDARSLADLSEAEDVVRMAVYETPARGIEHEIDRFFLLIPGHAEAVRAQPQVAHGLLQDGQIELLLKPGIDHRSTMQSATT